MHLVWLGLIFLYQGILSLSSNVIIKSPSNVIALTDDVTITVFNATEEVTVKLWFESDKFPLNGQIISRPLNWDDSDVTLVFDCGYFSRLGDYEFTVEATISNPEKVPPTPRITTFTSVTKWPHIKLHMKRSHEAFTTNVKVDASVPADICTSVVASRYDTRLVLLRNNEVVMATHNVNFPPPSIFFDCEVFSAPGNYQTQLRMTSMGSDVTIAQSDVMRVDWSGEYEIEVSENIFTCKGKTIEIPLKRPSCAPKDDVIQAVAMFANGLSYVIDNVTIGSSDIVSFACSKMLQVDASGICYNYLTGGSVVRTVCQSIHGKDFNVDGAWSAWTLWGTCSRLCSNRIGRRMRSCDNPRPSGNGEQCDTATNKTIGYEIKKDYISENIKCPADVTVASNMTSECLCGCTKLVKKRGILASPITGECNEAKTLVWRFYSLTNVLKFQVLDLQTRFGEIVTLSDRSVTTRLTTQFQTVTSKYKIVTLRYERLKQSRDSCGFVLLYQEVEPSAISTTPPSDKTHAATTPSIDRTLLHDLTSNPVAVGGIIVCVVVLLGVVFITIIRYRKQKLKVDQHQDRFDATLETRLTAPPDGKSSSNIDADSDRPSPVGENSRTDTIPSTPKPRVAYYLAQRQLELMKKQGVENSSQTYTASCMTDDNIRLQEALLFGASHDQSETNT